MRCIIKLGCEHYEIRLKKKVLDLIEQGAKVSTISKNLSIARSTIYRWIERNSDANSALERQPGTGRMPVLNLEEVNKILAYILHPASNFGFENDYWTSTRIASIIRKKMNKKIHRSTVHRMLTEHGQSSKKPECRFSEADEDKKALWIKNTVPAIKRYLTLTGGILYFYDEATVSMTPYKGRTWGPKGTTAIIKVSGSRGSVSAQSAISPSDSLVFSVRQGSIRSAQVIKFLKQLLSRHPKRQVVVVMDNASSHRSKVVKEFITTEARLKVYMLPAYSPEYNADEKVWAHLKSIELVGHSAKTATELAYETRRKLQKIARTPKLLRGIFKRSEISTFFE